MTPEVNAGAGSDSAEVRERLVEALNLDLIGRGPATRSPPSGFLAGFARRTGT